jgi:hypothetical protein
MPAKFAATPENVVRIVRTTLGVPSRMAAYAIRKPAAPPANAVTRLTSMLFLYAVMYGSSKRASMFESVKPPSTSLNAPTST